MRRNRAKAAGRSAAGQWVAGLALLALLVLTAGGALALTRLGDGGSRGAGSAHPGTRDPVQASAAVNVGVGGLVGADGAGLIALATVNVRIGPGLQFPIVGILAADSAAPILAAAPDRRWWRIECPLAIIAPECWVTADTLFVQVSALATPTPQPGDDKQARIVVTPTRASTRRPSPTPTVVRLPVTDFTPQAAPGVTATALPTPWPATPTVVPSATSAPTEPATPTSWPATPTQPAPAATATATSIASSTPIPNDGATPLPTLTPTATDPLPNGETPTVEPPTPTPTSTVSPIPTSTWTSTPTSTPTPLLTATPMVCAITADPVQLDAGDTTVLEILAPGAETLRLDGATGLITAFGPVAEDVRYSFMPSPVLFGGGDSATVTATARYRGGATAVCAVVLERRRASDRSVSVVAAHGESGYTADQVMTSYGLDYIPPYVMTAGPQTLQVHLASLQLGADRSVELLGGQQLASIPFTALPDGSVAPISFTVPQGQVLLLQVGDAQGRHFDTSRYLPVPYVAHSGDVAVLAFRDPGGIWHFRMEGSFELVRSQDLIYMSEVASQQLARVVGGTVLDNDIGRALARQERFGLWQLPGAGVPDGPWATQYMAAQCAERMVYDPDVVPAFVRVTGTNQFEDLRTVEEFETSLRSFPPPPNAADKFGPWYCTEVTQAWQPPVTVSEPR